MSLGGNIVPVENLAEFSTVAFGARRGASQVGQPRWLLAAALELGDRCRELRRVELELAGAPEQADCSIRFGLAARAGVGFGRSIAASDSVGSDGGD